MSCSGDGLPKQTAGRFIISYETVDGLRTGVTLGFLVRFVLMGSDQVDRSRKAPHRLL